MSVILFSLKLAAQSPGSPAPVVVELFTSEGCSSCPPADTLLRELDRSQPIAGANVIALSEHVDYWDDLGWKDTYSSHALTIRQENYARKLRVAGPYTPQMVVDGIREFVGSDRARAATAVQQAARKPKLRVRIAEAKLNGGMIRAHIEIDSLPSNAELFAAVVLAHAQSQVLRGENGGRRLEHVAVVQRLFDAGRVEKGKAFSKDVDLRASGAKGDQRIVAFVQETDQGRILGAAVENLPQ